MGKVRVGNRRTNTQRNINPKRIITSIIPTEWDDLIWDIAEDVITGWASDTILDAINGEEEQPQQIIQNNYVTNRYVTNTTVNNRVVPQTFPPRFNYRKPPTLWRNPKPVILPEPILPTDVDNQTATATPIGSSINVGASVQNDRYSMGKLIFHPYSTNKKGIRRKVPKNFLVLEYQKAQQRAKDNINKLKNGESSPIEYTGWLVATKNLAGLRGDGHVLLGINSISALAQTYRALSSIATIEPTNEIPVEYEDVDIDDKFTELKFSGKSDVADRLEYNLAEQLGYSDKDFEEKTVEEIIKDFGFKFYQEKKSQLKPIKTHQIENLEQFITYLVSAIFFRNGGHRFPSQLPASLLFDKDGAIYDKNLAGEDAKPIFIEDAIQWQEYLLTNLDAILGQFPAKIKYKNKDAQGNIIEKTLTLPNIAETLTELIGLGLGIKSDTDIGLALGVKNLLQGSMATNSAIIAADIARANAQFLGYKGNDEERDIYCNFTPGALHIEDLLEDSQQKVISFKNEDKNTLVDMLNKIRFATELTKSSVFHPLNKKELLGDGIREAKEQFKEQYDKEWENLKNYYNTPNKAKNGVNPYPNAKIKDNTNNSQI